ALAHDDGAVVVLQAGRHDLAGAGAVAIDQADHLEAKLRARRLAVHAVLLAQPRPADRHDRAFIDEQVADVPGDVEHATRVEAQVQDQGLHALFTHRPNGPRQLPAAGGHETGKADVADLVILVEPEVPAVVGIALDAEDRLQLDTVAGDLHLERLILALAL